VLKESAGDGSGNARAEAYELVLVYGDRAVYDRSTEYQFPTGLARRTRFCGYVVNRDESNPAPETQLVRSGVVRHEPAEGAGNSRRGGRRIFLLETFIRAAGRRGLGKYRRSGGR